MGGEGEEEYDCAFIRISPKHTIHIDLQICFICALCVHFGCGRRQLTTSVCVHARGMKREKQGGRGRRGV